MQPFIRNCAVIAAIGMASLAQADVFETYDSLSEGFKGETFASSGVTYRDVNRVSGFYPDGVPFNDTENGNEVIVENAALFYNDFPGYGSPVNSLTFGSAFIPGDNLSIGALASVWMDLPEVSNAASFDLAFYENGPWGNIEWRVEALSNGQVVGSDAEVISNLGGRDNPTFKSLSVGGVEFDQLHLYAWLNGAYTAPRGMIDNLSITAVPEPAGIVALLALGTIGVMRRRRS
jgi:hypothetical protein